jgi:predicted Zn-dependent peptidase
MNMESIDRTQQPDIKSIQDINIANARQFTLSNGLPVYSIESGTEEIVKVDLLIRAGSWFQPKPLVAAATGEMLTEGSGQFSSEEIAGQLDFYGAFLKSTADKDIATLSLLTLKKHLKPSLAILADILKNPTFPQKELNTYLNNKRQQFLLEHSKVNTLSRVKFNEALFGSHHPYGKITKEEDHHQITADDLKAFHQEYYTADRSELLVTGHVDESVHQSIEELLGGNDWKREDTQKKIPDFRPFTTTDREVFTPREDALQSALRIGKILFNKRHPDFPGMQVVNTILGGYFGSRLMKKIREEKGYTYGIYSMMIPLVNEGYLAIASEVGSNVCRQAIDDIYEEIRKLRNEKVDQQELDMVKNYMMAQLLRAFDGPLATASTYFSLLEMGLKEDYYQRVVYTINNITPDDVRELANKYLDEQTLIQSVAGNCQ